MASLKLSHIYKVYENGHKAVNDFNIDIKDKEFIVFVGPSGCGKSTTLRMIAGLEQITAGDLFIGDTLVNDMEPKDRDIAMVFQNYALYPHMSVYDNMAFSLRNSHVSEAVIKEKVLEAARILDIEDYLNRKPKAMSGGQRQRVALGRAIVRDPKVFLLDEPLSNLDAKLRAQMRTEITKLHKKLATTFIYVTHDQVEAMTMGTRIVVMKLGYVQQIDTPMNLYNKPYNKFVAGFIGTPQMNFFNVTLTRDGKNIVVKMLDNIELKFPYEDYSRISNSYLDGTKEVIFGIRPDHLSISEKETGMKCVVNAVEHLGNECIVYGTLGDDSSEFTLKDEGRNIIVKTVEGSPVAVGDVINIAPQVDKAHFFDAETEITLMEPIPKSTNLDIKTNGKTFELFDVKKDLPIALQDALACKTGEISFHIPPSAIVPGNTYKLDVAKIEEIDDKKLAFLKFEDRYVFALVNDDVKVGDSYNFDILFDKIEVVAEDEAVLSPISDFESFEGRFIKKEYADPSVYDELPEVAEIVNQIDAISTQMAGLTVDQYAEILPDMDEKTQKSVMKGAKKQYDYEIKKYNNEIKSLNNRLLGIRKMTNIHFFASFDGYDVLLPLYNGFKMNAVEGNKCYRKEYRYEVDRKYIQISYEGGIEARYIDSLDYGNVVYARFETPSGIVLVETKEKDFGEQVYLTFEGNNASIYSIEIDMKIC